MKLIDKDKVVTETERVLNSYDPNEITSGRYVLVDLRNFIDTLEVKKMDLEKEVRKFIKDNCTSVMNLDDMMIFAKHFYELGLKAKKGE